MDAVYIGNSDFYVAGPVGSIFDFKDDIKKITAGKEEAKQTNRSLSSNLQLWDLLAAALSRAGFPDNIVPFATAQALFESNNARSPVSQADHNFSGIKYRPKNAHQKNATQGRKSPEGDYYAHFQNMTDWAADFKRIVSQKNVPNGNGPGGPAAIDASDLHDYVHRLKVNGYYGGTEQAYYNALALIMSAHKQLPASIEKRAQAIQTLDNITNTLDHPLTSWIPSVPTWAKIGGAVVGGLIIVKLISK